MSGKQNKRAVTVGIFVFIALAIFVAGVLTLGGQQKRFAKTIRVKAVFDDVSGLQPGHNIWFAGMKVGTVKDLRFNSNRRVDVLMDIEEADRQYIARDARAKIGSDGLIGNRIVVLYGGTAGAPVIAEGDVLQAHTAVGMDDMMATFQENNDNLLHITANFKTISSELAAGKGTIGKLLKDESLVRELQATLALLKGATDKADDMLADVEAYTARLQTKGTLSHSLVTDTVVFSRLRTAAVQIDQVAHNANTLVGDLKAVSSNLGSTGNTVGMLLNDAATAKEIRETIRNLQSSTEKLDENMEALQHNFLLRGYFRKKARNR